MSNNAPSEEETTTINFPKFNLSHFVPKKPFFSYSATEPYQPCSENVDYIVFNVALDITSDTLTKMESIIKSNPYDVKSGPNLFYNETGANNSKSNGEIYIDCSPVGQSEETTEVVSYYSSSTSDFAFLNNPIIKLLLGSLLFIVILFVIKYALNYITPNKKINIFPSG